MRLAAFIAVLFSSAFAQEDAPPVYPVYYDYRIVNTYPHDPGAFTQGLFFDDGVLFESTGQFGESSLRKVDLKTGAVTQYADLPENIFGEGSVPWNDTIVTLTWRAGKGFVFDRETFEERQTFSYEGEGWGLTANDDYLIMSDGTSEIRFLDPATFEEVRRLTVTFRGKSLPRLNELEWIDGELYANIWQTNAIARINPENGVVAGIIDMRGLLSEEDKADARADVLNGVAYDKETGRLFVTGKYWPKLFEIELVERTRRSN